jgi:hypothetical protein
MHNVVGRSEKEIRGQGYEKFVQFITLPGKVRKKFANRGTKMLFNISR